MRVHGGGGGGRWRRLREEADKRETVRWKLRSAGETLAGKNQYDITLFTLRHSHLSRHAAVSFSPPSESAR